MSPFWQTVLRLAEEEREQTGQTAFEQLRDFLIIVVIFVLGGVECAALLATAK